jgi:hypothetical protein
VRRTLVLTGFGVWVLLACSPTSGRQLPVDGPPANLKASAEQLYIQYEAALKAQRRESLAGFYHVDGAVRVINGTTSRMSRSQLDSVYRTSWVPPAFFAWEQLSYDSLDPGTVLVTGGFRWTRAGAVDTMRYLYAAVLQAVDSGIAIRFEHETIRPPQ